jgi:hypothetical protein
VLLGHASTEKTTLHVRVATVALAKTRSPL